MGLGAPPAGWAAGARVRRGVYVMNECAVSNAWVGAAGEGALRASASPAGTRRGDITPKQGLEQESRGFMVGVPPPPVLPKHPGGGVGCWGAVCEGGKQGHTWVAVTPHRSAAAGDDVCRGCGCGEGACSVCQAAWLVAVPRGSAGVLVAVGVLWACCVALPRVGLCCGAVPVVCPS